MAILRALATTSPGSGSTSIWKKHKHAIQFLYFYLKSEKILNFKIQYFIYCRRSYPNFVTRFSREYCGASNKSIVPDYRYHRSSVLCFIYEKSAEALFLDILFPWCLTGIYYFYLFCQKEGRVRLRYRITVCSCTVLVPFRCRYKVPNHKIFNHKIPNPQSS